MRRDRRFEVSRKLAQSNMTTPLQLTMNPFLALDYEPAMESLGEDYFDVVAAAEFPQHLLRFRNNDLLPKLGLDPQQVADEDFIDAFGRFRGARPFLALCYHGYQFGAYNSRLGDGRGFLYGQVRGTDGRLYDLGTKGSGMTPYSRGADGRLTLKGGVREVLAGEALHRMGVRTSRCLSLIETGEALWRGDEPSPTRSSVMVRLSQTHVRFGTFERLHYLGRRDWIERLLDAVIRWYYPHLQDSPNQYAQFYAELVERTAELAAQWMAAGFCHGVLNTDNMSIVGESFDYGPYAFINTYDRKFTAAYFDYFGRYCYGNQPKICRLNLQMLQRPLEGAIATEQMEVGLAEFDDRYHKCYRQLMMQKLGFEVVGIEDAEELLKLTVQVLEASDIGYHEFFGILRDRFSPQWRDDIRLILDNIQPVEGLQEWRLVYHRVLQTLSAGELEEVAKQLRSRNPETALVRSEIETVWEPIAIDNNWQPFYDLLKRIKH